jgi:transcription termination factor Rho
MSVFSRSALEDSPLADLHVIAGELALDGYRRLRKADLIDAILAAQGGEVEEPPEDAATEEGVDDDAEERPARARRSRRGGRGGRAPRDAGADADADADDGDEPASDASDDEVVEKAPRVRSPRGGGGRDRTPRGGGGRDRDRDSGDGAEEREAEGVVELLANGSGFLRVSPPEPSDDDVYISAAQVRRCELVSGDRVSGPVRSPRRSERYPSLVRIDTINGKPADEVAEGTHYDDLPCGFPTERFALGGDDPTLKAIEWLTPLGRGSRATIVGPARAGKSEALRRLASALASQDGVELSVVLAGARPEEVSLWRESGLEPAAAAGLSASGDAQAQAIERVTETARRVAARGGHAVVLIDGLDGVSPHVGRRALGAARNIVDGGSLTIVATAPQPVGGETTVITLDRTLTSTGRFPALDLAESGTLRPVLVVGQAGADAIAEARAAALG